MIPIPNLTGGAATGGTAGNSSINTFGVGVNPLQDLLRVVYSGSHASPYNGGSVPISGTYHSLYGKSEIPWPVIIGVAVLGVVAVFAMKG